MAHIAPSILSADFSRLGEEVKAVEAAGARTLHVDVMDGHFVPNITIGPPVVASLKRATRLPLDCHLMIEDPDRYIEEFAQAGAGWITVHQEAVRHLHRTVAFVRSLGLKAGVAINPATPVTVLEDIIQDVDHVLVMSVNPGFGGQKFIPRALDKIREVREMIERRGATAEIEIDGGVGPGNAADVVKAGAKWLVAGSAVFGGGDPGTALRELEKIAESGNAG